MVKKIYFSVIQNHNVIKEVINSLKLAPTIELVHHDPTKDFFYLSDMPSSLKNADLIVVKVRNECSIDLLHFAKLYNLPTLHDVETVLVCKNKIALDYSLRKVFEKHKDTLGKFRMPNSWNQSLVDVIKFKEWALPKLPIVIKSHFQHDKYNRFNFLVQKIDDIDIFCKRYKQFLSYDVYIQQFIECDGLEIKIYVIGEKVFGIKRENPIYIYLRDKPENIDVSTIKRESFEVTEEIKNFSKILSNELNLKIFGFDMVCHLDNDKYYIIDLNDFPSFRGIPNAEKDLKEYIESYALSL
ncbi:MAG: ATP-grasp domain-containing protein [Promethearchaeota archaeon]|jgi:glutathione synthase/RimK-type ligase-like ATP-grasp enzyme